MPNQADNESEMILKPGMSVAKGKLARDLTAAYQEGLLLMAKWNDEEDLTQTQVLSIVARMLGFTIPAVAAIAPPDKLQEMLDIYIELGIKDRGATEERHAQMQAEAEAGDVEL